MSLGLWLLAAAAVLVALLVSARKAWRRAMRRELRVALAEVAPQVEVVAETERSLELRLPGGTTGTAFLDNFYAVLSSGTATDEERKQAIATFARSLVSQQEDAARPLSLERHGERLLPRLTQEGLLAEGRGDDPLVHSPSGLPGLVVTYVLDGEYSVMYLTRSRLAELGLEAAALQERALGNLRRTFPAQVVRQAVDQKQMTMMRAGDSFDATRLLLVPSVLEEGEALAAVIPDRETLALMPVPEDGDWGALAKVARTPGSPYRLLDRPLRVTRSGFEVIG